MSIFFLLNYVQLLPSTESSLLTVCFYWFLFLSYSYENHTVLDMSTLNIGAAERRMKDHGMKESSTDQSFFELHGIPQNSQQYTSQHKQNNK